MLCCLTFAPQHALRVASLLIVGVALLLINEHEERSSLFRASSGVEPRPMENAPMQSTSDSTSLAGAPKGPIVPNAPAEFDIPGPSELTLRSYQSFLRDLEALLTAHSGEFVAYAGDLQLGIDWDGFALEKRIGLPLDQYEMYYIEPQDLHVAGPSL
jgi:hypothetical protein